MHGLVQSSLSVPETSIAPELSTNSASDSSEVVPVPEIAANAVLKFADNSLKLTVEAGIYSHPKKKQVNKIHVFI